LTFLKRYGKVIPYQQKGGSMPYRDPARPKRFVIQLSLETHKQLKILAAKLETTMDKLANQLIEEEIRKEKENG